MPINQKDRVEVVWPKTGHKAKPLKQHLQAWLDAGWKQVTENKEVSK